MRQSGRQSSESLRTDVPQRHYARNREMRVDNDTGQIVMKNPVYSPNVGRELDCDAATVLASPVATGSRSAVDFAGRARRGTSGALYLQSAPAGLNSHPRSPFSRAAASSDVEDRVPRSGESRTVSGPEGSSTKRSSSGAAERPGPSRSSMWARVSPGRRWVHGIADFAARDRRKAS
jgi:hypothetical protein